MLGFQAFLKLADALQGMRDSWNPGWFYINGTSFPHGPSLMIFLMILFYNFLQVFYKFFLLFFDDFDCSDLSNKRGVYKIFPLSSQIFLPSCLLIS